MEKAGFYGWSLNQSGTHYADYRGRRVSVRRTAPRARTFTAKVEGVYVGVFDDLDAAKAAALAAVETQ